MNLQMALKRTMTLVSGLSLLAAGLLGGCGKPASEAVDRPNLLVATGGDVRLKRAGWSDYVPVGFGTFLQSKDLLEVNGTALVLCGDLSVKPIEGRDSCPCRTTLNHVVYDGAKVSTRTSQDPEDDVPYIIHPRNTLVASLHPLLRWRDVGGTSYTVSIASSSETVWSQSGVTGDRIQYPDDAPRLRPDAEYLLVVQDEATEANSRDDPVKELMFRVLSEAEQEVVEAERDAILSLKTLDESSRRLALAIYYATYSPPVEEGAAEGIERRLWGEAWLLLESVAQEQDSPAVHLWMGNVLAATKLPTEAEAAYRSALESAEALGDLESQAAAQAGLWRMTENKDRFECALALYEQLGDRRAVRALEEKKER